MSADCEIGCKMYEDLEALNPEIESLIEETKFSVNHVGDWVNGINSTTVFRIKNLLSELKKII